MQDSVLKQFKAYREQAATVASLVQAKESGILKSVLHRLPQVSGTQFNNSHELRYALAYEADPDLIY